MKRLSRTERVREIRLSLQVGTSGYILLKGERLCSPPVSSGLFQPALAVRRCSWRPLDWVWRRQGPDLVAPLVVSRALGAIAFGIACPATPPTACISFRARLVVLVLRTRQPRRRCGSITLPRRRAFTLFRLAISPSLAIRALTLRDTAASGPIFPLALR